MRIAPFMPAIITLLLIPLSHFHFAAHSVSHLFPLLGVMSIFYWLVYAPIVMPLWLILLIGIWIDALNGTPFGMTSLSLFMVTMVLLAHRYLIVNEGFVVIWTSFAVTILIYSSLHWGILSLYYMTPMPVIYAVLQAGISILIYPLVHKCFTSLHKALH